MSAVIEGLERDRLAAVKERDALRAEVERIEADRVRVLEEGESIIANLRRERDDLRRSLSHETLMELRNTVALVTAEKERAEHAHNELVLSLRDAFRDVAERQREACAARLRDRELPFSGPLSAEWNSEQEATARFIRATPLVTDGGGE